MLVELALLQYHDIIKTLKYSKSSSPLFAQRKPDGKLRMLLDLRRINHLIRHDYDNNNYPVTSLMDAAMHFAGKPIKSTMDCAQAFHGIEAADAKFNPVDVVQLRFTHFHAYKRLAQGLSRSATAFSSYIRQSLHKCITNDQCEAYMDDIGAGSHTFEEHVVAIEAIFDSIKKAGLRLSMSKCEFGVKEIEFLGMNYTADGVQPIRRKIEDFLETMKMPKTVRQIQRLAGFCQFYKYYIPHLANLRPPLQPLSALAVRPGHMMQIDLVSNMPKAGPYRHVFTGIDVFSKYMFAVPLARVHARDVAAALMSMFLRHSYIPEVILTDLGSAFTSSLMKEVTDLLEIELSIATIKHPQTIGLLERAHATFKKHLKMYESANHTDWYKDVDYAVFSHNTSYRLETGATPACIFQGHTPIKSLDMRFGNKALLKNRSVFEPTQEIKDRLLRLYRRQKEYLVDSYMKYKDYHDDKLAPKWLPTYRVEKKWTNENYLVRKCGTHLTQNVHRIRLRPFVPQYEVPDEDQVNPSRFVRDDTIPREPEIFDDVREAMTRDRIDNQARYTTTDIDYVPPPGPSDEPYPDLDQRPSGRLVLTPPDPEALTED